MTIIRQSEAYGYFRLTADVFNHTEEVESGYISTLATWEDDYAQSEWDIRSIKDRFSGFYVEGDGASVPRWITFNIENPAINSSFIMGLTNFECPDTACVSVHRPGWITDHSWLRVCRILGWKK